ncbi:MAG: hypothetical protein ABIF19_13785 [Planctomycetota bacterium]
MRKVKVVTAAIVAVPLVAGMLVLSTYAKGKPPKPEPVLAYVDITGGIEGNCDNPAEISIEFLDDSFGIHAGSFVANPDYPPALEVGGPGINRRLTYYYCDHPEHNADGLEENTICAVEDHSPYYYKELMISGGKVTSKRGEDLTVVFPAGSTWRISWKETMEWEYAGTLNTSVTYTEVYK